MPGSSYQNGHSVKLNLLQRLMRHWEQLHPYNAVHAIKVRGRLDLAASRRAWEDALEALGLGAISYQGNSYAYRRLNGESSRHTVELRDPAIGLAPIMSAELNRSFEGNEEVPFRPFAIEGEDHFWLCLSYRHWVADSAAIRMVLREWFVRQFDAGRASDREARLWSDGYVSRFGPHRSNWQCAPALLDLMRLQHQIKQSRRIEDGRAFGNLKTRFERFEVPDGLIDRLRQRARDENVRMVDLFLATIAEACDRYAPIQWSWKRRLAVESIVDLRAKGAKPLDEVFGVVLGFTNVCCSPRELKDWDSLLAAVCRQTNIHRQRNDAEASWLRMAAGLAMSKVISRDRILEFYRKRLPTAAGLSAVSLNDSWVEDYYPARVMDYVRAVPPGPVAPLAFAPTTLGGGMSLGVTYRESVISPQLAEVIARAVIDRLGCIAEHGAWQSGSQGRLTSAASARR